MLGHLYFLNSIGSFIFSIAVFTSSFLLNNFVPFLIVYGCFTGMVIGVCYVIPINNSISHFPDKAGLISGYVLAGFGLGSFVFSQISLAMINPHNLKVI